MKYNEFYDACREFYLQYEELGKFEGMRVFNNFDRNEINSEYWYFAVRINNSSVKEWLILAYKHTNADDYPIYIYWDKNHDDYYYTEENKERKGMYTYCCLSNDIYYAFTYMLFKPSRELDRVPSDWVMIAERDKYNLCFDKENCPDYNTSMGVIESIDFLNEYGDRCFQGKTMVVALYSGDVIFECTFPKNKEIQEEPPFVRNLHNWEKYSKENKLDIYFKED